MKITITNDFRLFKKDDVFELEFRKERKKPDENRFLFLIGDNGCGKSTILKSIRKYKTSNATSDFGIKRTEKNINLSSEIQDISKNVLIEDIDYDVIDALDGEFDNPSDWGNCMSAGDFVDNGGYKTQHLSNGMKSISSFIDWVRNSREQFIPNKTLFLLDEVEKGWKIDFCVRMTEILNKHFKGCDFIIVSHNPLCCLGAYGNYEFYDVETKKYYEEYKEYFTNKTSMYIDLSFIDKDKFIDRIISELKDDNNKLKVEIEKLKSNEKE